MNKVEEGAPAKVTQRKRFHCSCSTEESERGKDFLRFKSQGATVQGLHILILFMCLFLPVLQTKNQRGTKKDY